MARPLCNHCHVKPQNRPGGLCWGCYYRLGVRALYVRKSRHANYGYGIDGTVRQQGTPRPTFAGPGTLDKIAVLRRRARLNQPLFLGGDAGWIMNALVDVEEEKGVRRGRRQ